MARLGRLIELEDDALVRVGLLRNARPLFSDSHTQHVTASMFRAIALNLAPREREKRLLAETASGETPGTERTAASLPDSPKFASSFGPAGSSPSSPEPDIGETAQEDEEDEEDEEEDEEDEEDEEEEEDEDDCPLPRSRQGFREETI